MRRYFFVEGEMERRIVQRLCRSAPVTLIGVFGHKAKAENLANRVAAKARIQKADGIIIVVFDREKRLENSDVLEIEVEMLLKKALPKCRIVVGVPDREFESWILAGLRAGEINGQGFSEFRGPVDGMNGKKVLRKHLGDIQYDEVPTGVSLFCNHFDREIACARSPSFSKFWSRIQEAFGAPCHFT